MVAGYHVQTCMVHNANKVYGMPCLFISMAILSHSEPLAAGNGPLPQIGFITSIVTVGIISCCMSPLGLATAAAAALNADTPC